MAAMLSGAGCGSGDGLTGGDEGQAGATTVRMGKGVGNGFSAGALELGLATLSAGGTTSITTTLVKSDGSLYDQAATVLFSSTCSAFGDATITSPVTTSTGVAISTYTATGCSGSDVITATTSIGGATLTATATVTITAATLGSIQFISVSPSTLALKNTGGAGLSETATVTFKVLDQTGSAVSGTLVDFALNTSVGGLSLVSSTGTSLSDGTVQAIVQSGTVPTTVRVTATINGTSISTQSTQLVVTTGLPDQDSFSLSASTLNPEGWDIDGTEVTITARLADRFNNPVPDGTAVYFTTEGGSIQGSCTTDDGACSVLWRSQNPKPCGQVLGDTVVTLDTSGGPNVCINDVGVNTAIPQSGFAALGQPYGGRATISAVAIGEESFIDVNGNGTFDDGETFTDLAEHWRDDDEDGVRDAHEIFFDFDADSTFDNAADGKFNGVLCTHATLCSAQKTLHVRQSLVLVMADSEAVIDISPNPIAIATNGGSQQFTVTLSDLHNQPLPQGTTVAVTTTYGKIAGTTSFTIPNTQRNSALAYTFTLEGTAPDELKSGTLTVTVTAPSGLITPFSVPVSEPAP